MSDNDSEYEGDLTDATEEEIQEIKKQWKKCSKCKRYVYGHKGQYGKYCSLSQLSQEELEQENNKIEEERILKMRNKRKEPTTPPNTRSAAARETDHQHTNQQLENHNLNTNNEDHVNAGFNPLYNSTEQFQQPFMPVVSQPPYQQPMMSTQTPPTNLTYQQPMIRPQQPQTNHPYQQPMMPPQQSQSNLSYQQLIDFQMRQSQIQQTQMAQQFQQMMQMVQNQQKTFYDQMNQSNMQGRNVTRGNSKNVPVPKWNAGLSFKAWKRNVENWAKEIDITETQKVLNVIESLKANDERKLKDWIITNIDEDIQGFDHNNQDALKTLLKRMEDKFEESPFKRTKKLWKDLLAFEAIKGETPRQYVERFSMLETRMKTNNCTMSAVLLAHHFLIKAKLPAITVQNILARIKTENNPEILSDVKEAYEKPVDETKASSNTEVFYRKNYRSHHRERSHSTDGRISDKRYPRQEDNARKGREQSQSKDNYRSRSRLQSRSRSRSRGRRYDDRSHKTTYTCEKWNIQNPEIRDKTKDNIVQSEQANEGIVDSGCPKSVMGSLFESLLRDAFAALGFDATFKERSEKESFKFGPSKVYNSYKETEITLRYEDFETKMWVSVVHANIPLLIGKNHLKDEWKCKMDYEAGTLTFGHTGVTIKLNESGGHYTINIIDGLKAAKKEIVNDTFFNSTDLHKKEAIRKLHRLTGHKQPESLRTLIKNAGHSDSITSKLITEVVSE